MLTTAETGRAGEQAALQYLRREGYTICHVNWRQGRYELDIVARKGWALHVVEVKTRHCNSVTPPEAAMTYRKEQALLRAVNAYVAVTAWDGEVFIDVIAVDLWPDGRMDLRFVPDVVQPHW